jgi:hypothetical protein
MSLFTWNKYDRFDARKRNIHIWIIYGWNNSGAKSWRKVQNSFKYDFYSNPNCSMTYLNILFNITHCNYMYSQVDLNLKYNYKIPMEMELEFPRFVLRFTTELTIQILAACIPLYKFTSQCTVPSGTLVIMQHK